MVVKCPKCQFDNPEGTKFCGQCGAKLEPVCASCGHLNPPGFRYCGECGQPLGEQKAPVPVDYSKPQSYTPKFLAEKILSIGKSMEGERKLVTVLFADLANYTAMSEKLDPEEVHQIMDGCFKILMDEVHRYEGTVDKFTGDGMMALFGAPVAHEDHTQRACYAALGIQKALQPYADKVKKESKVDFKMRVGLNSGPVMVGTVGSDLRMDYTAVGDTVNLASRMQTMAEPGRILVSADVHKMARDFFNFKARGKMSVKGKEEAVEAYGLLEPTEVASRIEAAALRGLTRFVGREKEMATLREAFEKAKSGSGQVVCIVGEAGVGKSRLLLELRRTLESDEYTYLEGQCLHYGSSMPYLPLLDILRSYFGLKEGEREFLVRKRLEEKTSAIDPKLKAILPPLQELLSLKVEDKAYLKLEPQKKREKTFEAIRDILVVESQRKPLVLAVEDLHWIDKTSEEFLAYFIGHLPKSRILLLLLYRPEYTHQWASKSCYSQIRVDELPTKSSADLVRAMLEEGEVAPELRELILNRAAGNPLFMEEFTHTLLENGSIQKKDHQYVLSRKPSEIHVPDTIQGIIAARMDRLDENLKRIMQVASVIGRDFAYRILQTITGMQEELKGHLVNLQGLELIYEKSLYPELEYVFKHALTQEVAYNSLLLKRRKQIHEKIGKAIEELYPDRLEEFCEALAHHYSRSDNLERAYWYLRLSAEKAFRSQSSREACRLLDEALDILNRLPDSTESKRRRLELTLLRVRPSGYDEALVPAVETGLEIAAELNDHSGLARLCAFLCTFYFVKKGDHVRGIEYGEKAWSAAEIADEPSVACSAGMHLALVYNYRGDTAKLADIAGKAISLFESQGTVPEDLQVDANLGIDYVTLLGLHGVAQAVLGHFEQAKDSCDKSLRWATKLNHSFGMAQSELSSWALSVMKGDGAGAELHAREAVKHCEGSQILFLLGMSWTGVAWGLYLQGDLAAAWQCAQKAISTYANAGMGLALCLSHLLLGAVSLDSGDLRQAQASVEEALRLSLEHDEGMYQGWIRIWLGRVLHSAAISASSLAERNILEGLEDVHTRGLRAQEASGYLLQGEGYALGGQHEKALGSLTKAKQMCLEMGIGGYWLARTEKALAKLEG